MFEVGEILLAIEREAQHHDGLVTFPAYLLQQMHSEVFPDDPDGQYDENDKTADWYLVISAR
jgi:hypothetical protein